MSDKHHFHLNAAVNFLVGNLPLDDTDPNYLKVALKQLNLIADEFEELEEGVRTLNIKEVRDGLGDVVVTVDGLYYRLGIRPLMPLQGNFDDGAELSYPLNNIRTALKELRELFEPDNNMPYCWDITSQEWRDEVTDKIHVMMTACYLLAARCQIDLQQDQEAIYASNMSKFDTDKDVAYKGVLKYLALGVRTALFPNSIEDTTYLVIKSIEDQVGSDGKKYPAGKFLKSVLFQEPEFAPLAPDARIIQIFARSA
ncbi:hypothetical protein LUCX_201 [Xanthomonas phage vB_XciM_LucasX]|nr:hypothetical protein LUCX_201 [Xanthomonas phage vB_XciM_LucasX]